MLRSRPPFTGVLQAPGPESDPGVLFERFWAPGSECPKECSLSAFWRFWGSKSAKKHSKSQVPKIAQKALRGALSGPGAWSTPVNGGRDRNTSERKISPKFSCIKFFQGPTCAPESLDVPTHITGHPGHSLSKATEKCALQKVFVQETPQGRGQRYLDVWVTDVQAT